MSTPASSKLWPALIALIIGAGLGVIVWQRVAPNGAASNPPAATTPVAAPTATPLAPALSVEPAAVSSTTAAPEDAQTPLPTGDAALEAITDLAVTYDAAAVPALARYLGHSDPEIRSAARDGLIQLGERAAIPFLEAAAKTAPVDEAKELREAAEFLALPTWTERRAEQKKAKAAAANAPKQ